MENYIDLELVDQFFERAHYQASLAVCMKKKVGAVMVNNMSGEIVGKGFGGAKEPCKECVRKKLDWQQDGCWAVHSELRAIFNFFERNGFHTSLPFAMMFVTHGPCDQCIKYMHYFGIPIIAYDIEYHNDYSKWDGKVRIFQKEELKKEIKEAREDAKTYLPPV